MQQNSDENKRNTDPAFRLPIVRPVGLRCNLYLTENRRLLKAADDLGMTQKQLNDYVNARAANIFDPQNKTDNLSHKHEKPGIDDLKDIKDDMSSFLEKLKKGE